MEMQDKEFDQLFNSKLGGFEVEPSEQVWQNITRELDGKKARRSIMPYLGIAASVIIITSFSLWFYNSSNEEAEQPGVKIVKDIKPFKGQVTPTKSNTSASVEVINDKIRVNETDVAKEPVKNVPGNNRATTATEQIKEEAVAIAEVPAQKPEPMLAARPIETKLPLPEIHVNDVMASTRSIADHPVENMEKQADPIVDTPEIEKIPAKKRARGLGGLINTVIAAVDKREDKLIEFTDADNDEGSRVTSVNLGIFKIKKQ